MNYKFPFHLKAQSMIEKGLCHSKQIIGIIC